MNPRVARPSCHGAAQHGEARGGTQPCNACQYRPPAGKIARRAARGAASRCMQSLTGQPGMRAMDQGLQRPTGHTECTSHGPSTHPKPARAGCAAQQPGLQQRAQLYAAPGVFQERCRAGWGGGGWGGRSPVVYRLQSAVRQRPRLVQLPQADQEGEVFDPHKGGVGGRQHQLFIFRCARGGRIALRRGQHSQGIAACKAPRAAQRGRCAGWQALAGRVEGRSSSAGMAAWARASCRAASTWQAGGRRSPHLQPSQLCLSDRSLAVLPCPLFSMLGELSGLLLLRRLCRGKGAGAAADMCD